MLSARLLTLLVCALSLIPLARAQHTKDPLKPAEEEQVRAASDEPNDRVKLYIKFLEQRTDSIHATMRHPATQHPGADIHNALEQFTRLTDELADNLDAYDESHTDIRKSLKFLLEHSAKWPAILKEPQPSPEYDFARKTALDAADSLTDAATKLQTSQLDYFAKHKEPKR